jgi:hypothetical protein
MLRTFRLTMPMAWLTILIGGAVLLFAAPRRAEAAKMECNNAVCAQTFKCYWTLGNSCTINASGTACTITNC